MLKYTALFFFFILPLLSSAQTGFSIKGNVKGLPDQSKIYLLYESEDKQVFDSTIVKNGSFIFVGKVKYPVFANVSLNINPYVQKPAKGQIIDYFRFYLENSPINFTAADSLKKILITGSPGNELRATLKAMMKENDDQFTALNKAYEALPEASKKDSLIMDSLTKRENQLMKESAAVHIAFATKYPDSYLSVISLSYIAAQPGITQEVRTAYNKLSPALKATPIGKDIPVLLASQDLVKIGKPAPGFSQQGVTGAAVSLSDFKNGYVLVDFWASWCGPCRAENPNLVAAYEKYKPQGFQVLGVSLDNPGKKGDWLKAIEKDHLKWTQVSDLKGWDNAVAKMYGVRSIPANFLIDPSGKIIATDLRGESLSKKLEEIYKKEKSGHL